MSSPYVVTREGQIHRLGQGPATVCGTPLTEGATEYDSLQDLKDVTRQVSLRPCLECLSQHEADYLSES